MELPNGYQMISTFDKDFAIADTFGIDAIRDTYKRAFAEWKDNYIYLTELVIVLNHRIWRWYQRKTDYAHVYDELWREADAYACVTLQGDELSHFFRVTD